MTVEPLSRSFVPASPGLSALELARRLGRTGETTSEVLVERCLDRIREANPRLQAFVSIGARSALADARAKDKERLAGRALPLFHGMPIAVKDIHLVRGHFARMGSRAYRWLWSPIDDVTVAALRRAGFVLIGKLSTSELALLPVVEPEIHGPTRNPWNDAHTAGGSSGGSASAVASGMLPFAPGTDGAGSIRIPAAFCGLVGFKTSRGLIPNPWARLDTNGLGVIGPIARSTTDAAALLDCLVGQRASPRSFSDALRDPPCRLRIRMMTRPPIGETHPDMSRAVHTAADALRALGHDVDEVDPPIATLDDFLPIFTRMAASSPVFFESLLEPVSRWLRAEGRRRTVREVDVAVAKIRALAEPLHRDAEMLLTPTTPVPAPRVGQESGLPPEQQFRALSPLGAFTAPWNVTGQPAISIPAGFTTQGLPIGVQLVGRLGADAQTLSLAHQLEAALEEANNGHPSTAVRAQSRVA